MAGEFKLNPSALGKIAKSPEVGRVVDARAAAIASAAGPGYKSANGEERRRQRAIVFPATSAAIRDNARNGTLLRVFHADPSGDA